MTASSLSAVSSKNNRGTALKAFKAYCDTHLFIPPLGDPDWANVNYGEDSEADAGVSDVGEEEATFCKVSMFEDFASYLLNKSLTKKNHITKEKTDNNRYHPGLRWPSQGGDPKEMALERYLARR